MYIPASLRRFVIDRAKNCCEYCLISQIDIAYTFPIDHAIAEKHGGETDEHNLCLACYLCNAHKGSDIASIDQQTGAITPLFNLRKHTWADHFKLDGAVIEPLTPEGRTTVFLLQLNTAERVAERHLLGVLGRYPCPER